MGRQSLGRCSTVSDPVNPSGLTEAEVEDGIAFADAAQYLAGGRASEQARELAREVLRGNLTGDEAVDEYLAEYEDRRPRQ